MRDHIVEAFDDELQIRPQRLQLLVPEEMVVSRSALWRSGSIQVVPLPHPLGSKLVEAGVLFVACFGCS